MSGAIVEVRDVAKRFRMPSVRRDTVREHLFGALRRRTFEDLVVLDGVSFEAVSEATKVGINAVCAIGAAGGIVAVDAGNYGGNLGPFHFKLREIMAADAEAAR